MRKAIVLLLSSALCMGVVCAQDTGGDKAPAGKTMGAEGKSHKGEKKGHKGGKKSKKGSGSTTPPPK